MRFDKKERNNGMNIIKSMWLFLVDGTLLLVMLFLCMIIASIACLWRIGGGNKERKVDGI